MSIPRIGRGKNMSIAKAALKFYYEELDREYWGEGDPFLTYGDLGYMHRIVDIAGANHASMFTASQVSSCLASSPYWDKEFHPFFYKGTAGNGGANMYRPSRKGKDFYYSHLKYN